MGRRLPWIILSLLLSLSQFGFAQQPKLLKSISVKARLFAADNLNDLYIVNEQGDLLKYDDEFKLLNRFSENRYGDLTSIDPTNPLNLLLFYGDFNTIQILDQQLGSIGLLQLTQKGMTDISAAATSQDNDIWIYDNSTKQLKKISTSASVVAASEDLFQAGLVEDEPFSFIRCRNNWIYCLLPSKGVMIFDNFGNYYTRLALPVKDHFQVMDRVLYYFADGQLHFYQLDTHNEGTIPLPANLQAQDARVSKGRLYIQTAEAIHIYEL